MTAATIHRPDGPRPQAPVRLPGQPPSSLPRQRDGRPARRPVLELVPPLAAPSERTVRPASPGAVHLTGRGRCAVLVLLVVAGVALMLALTGLVGLVGGAAAGTAPARTATRTIVVQPGQTLWSIAGSVAPNVDRRDTIARIVELNALPSTGVSAGARIAVPAP